MLWGPRNNLMNTFDFMAPLSKKLWQTVSDEEVGARNRSFWARGFHSV